MEESIIAGVNLKGFTRGTSLITKMKLENIQSWREDDQIVEFSDTRLNVIRGRSETGKSVIYKLFYQMAFPNYYKFRSKNDLIRKGFTQAKTTFWFKDGTIVEFFIEHSTQYFKIMMEGEENSVILWEKSIPDVLVSKFGLIIDYNLKIIINVMIKDNPYPFVTTPSTWDAKYLDVVFKHQDTENAINTLKADNIKLEKGIETLKPLVNTKKMQDKIIKHKDIEVLQRYKGKVERISELYDKLDNVRVALGEITSCSKQIEEINLKILDLVDVNDVAQLIHVLHAMYIQTASIAENTQVIESAEQATRFINEIEKYRNLTSIVAAIYEYIEDMEQQYYRVLKLNKEITSIKESTANMLESKCALAKYTKFIDITECLAEGIGELFNLYKDTYEIITQENIIKKELEEIKTKISICPTCNRPI